MSVVKIMEIDWEHVATIFIMCCFLGVVAVGAYQQFVAIPELERSVGRFCVSVGPISCADAPELQGMAADLCGLQLPTCEEQAQMNGTAPCAAYCIMEGAYRGCLRIECGDTYTYNCEKQCDAYHIGEGARA